MLNKLIAALFGVSLIAVLAVAGPAGAAAGDGTVYVVHGIPGVSVDVYVNGTKTLPNFAPGKVAGPLSLPAGSYAIKIFKAGDNPASATPVIDKSVDLPAGANASLVAGLDATGKPTLFTFVNDVSAAPAGQGRLAVAHTAAAPAVDVLANGSPAFKNLMNGNEDKADLPAGTISASVVAAGTTTPALIGPANVPVTAGMVTASMPSVARSGSECEHPWCRHATDPARFRIDGSADRHVGTPRRQRQRRHPDLCARRTARRSRRHPRLRVPC